MEKNKLLSQIESRMKKCCSKLMLFFLILCNLFMSACSGVAPYAVDETVVEQQTMSNLRYIPIFISLEGDGVSDFSEESKMFYQRTVREPLEKKGIKTVASRKNNSFYYTLECSFFTASETNLKLGMKAIDALASECILIDPYKNKVVYKSLGSEAGDHFAIPVTFLNLFGGGGLGALYMGIADLEFDELDIKQTMRSALSGLDKFMEDGTISSQKIPFDVIGVDDGVKENKRIDFDQALFNAKTLAAQKAGASVFFEGRLSTNSNSQEYEETIEKFVDSLLVPGFTVEDQGYTRQGYSVRLKGYILKN